MINFPPWWSWELELSLHVLRRMIDRDFSETELRTMLDDAFDISPNKEPGRWTVTTRHDGNNWKVILEPLDQERIIRVITAFQIA